MEKKYTKKNLTFHFKLAAILFHFYRIKNGSIEEPKPPAGGGTQPNQCPPLEDDAGPFDWLQLFVFIP